MGDRGDLLGHKDQRGQLGSVEEVVEWAWERVRERRLSIITAVVCAVGRRPTLNFAADFMLFSASIVVSLVPWRPGPPGLHGRSSRAGP